jgi:ABC-2 type transport system permease protein
MSITVIAALVRKDLQVFFSDRRQVVLTLAVPIAIAAFFGFVFNGASNGGEPTRMKVAVADEDGSAISKALVAETSKDKALTMMPMSTADARAQVQAGRLAVAVVIPPGFGDAAGRAFLSQTERPQLRFLTDPSRVGETSMVKGIVTGHVMEAVAQEVFTGEQGRALVDDGLKRLETSGMPDAERVLLTRVLTSARDLYLEQDAGRLDSRPRGGIMRVPFDAHEEAVTGTGTPYNGFAHSFAGMGIQFALFAAIDLAAGILLERERGLWKRLRSAPLSRATLIVAKAVSGTILTAMVLGVSFLFARLVFKVHVNNVVGFGAVLIASAFMASTFGVLVAALGHTPAATRRVAMFVVLVMVMLGGAWVPSFIFPQWMQQATLVIPVRWAVDGLDAMTWRNLPLSAALTSSALLVAFALVCGAAALWRFRWDEA